MAVNAYSLEFTINEGWELCCRGKARPIRVFRSVSWKTLCVGGGRAGGGWIGGGGGGGGDVGGDGW